MKNILKIMLAMLISGLSFAGTHIVQGDAITAASLTCTGSPCGSGGSGSSTLATGNGTSGSIGTVISSPTATINFDSNAFKNVLQGSATSFVTLNAGATYFIQNTGSLQSSSQFYVSSGTVGGNLIATGTSTFRGNIAISSGVLLSNSAGTSGQALLSAGIGAVPTWGSPTAATSFVVARTTETVAPGGVDYTIDSWTGTLPAGGCLLIEILAIDNLSDSLSANAKFWVGTSSAALGGIGQKGWFRISVCNGPGTQGTQYIYGIGEIGASGSPGTNFMNGTGGTAYDGWTTSVDFSTSKTISITVAENQDIRMNWFIQKTY